MPCQRVSIVQSYVPQYRVAFFEELRRKLEARGIALSVWSADAPKGQAARGDTGELRWAQHYQLREVPIGPSRIRTGMAPSAWRDSDLVVVEHTSLALMNYWLAATRHERLALWGHGAAFVASGRRLPEALKHWQLRRSRHYFAYTPGGASRVVSLGYPKERVTVVMNSTDTRSLHAARLAVTAQDEAAVRDRYGLTDQTVLFLGALDVDKRLDFLLEAGDLLSSGLPAFRCLIAGDGPLRPWLIREISSRAWAVYVGPARSDAFKAKLAAASRCLVMPGRVGLVAVDSFALGVPVVSTRWSRHGPEFEYLVDGVNAVITSDHVADYARSLRVILTDGQLGVRLASSGQKSLAGLSTSRMAARFAGGVSTALALG